MQPKEMCSSIAVNLRNIADIVESLGDFVSMIDEKCPVEIITDAEVKDEYSDQMAVEYLTQLATVDKGVKKNEIKTLINK